MAVLSKAEQFGRDLAAHAIAPLLRRLAPDPKYFELWQSHGLHVLPSDDYQPIPDTRVLPLSLWNRISDLPVVSLNLGCCLAASGLGVEQYIPAESAYVAPDLSALMFSQHIRCHFNLTHN